MSILLALVCPLAACAFASLPPGAPEPVSELRFNGLQQEDDGVTSSGALDKDNHSSILSKLLDLDVAIADNGDGAETLAIRYEGRREFLKLGDDLDQSLELRYSGVWAVEEENNPENLLESSLAYVWDVRNKEEVLSRVPSSGINWWGHVDANVGLDANQDFSKRQLHFGFEAEFSMQAENSAQPHYWWIGDYPAAALRALSGASKGGEFIPSYLPRIKVGIEQVTTDGQDPRAAFGDDSDFTRAYGEVHYRPLAFSTNSNQWVLDVSYRHFHELDASDAVKSADVGDFGFLKIDLLAASGGPGFFLRFVDGQLPFDVENGQSLQVGWSTNLGQAP